MGYPIKSRSTSAFSRSSDGDSLMQRSVAKARPRADSMPSAHQGQMRSRAMDGGYQGHPMDHGSAALDWPGPRNNPATSNGYGIGPYGGGPYGD